MQSSNILVDRKHLHNSKESSASASNPQVTLHEILILALSPAMEKQSRTETQVNSIALDHGFSIKFCKTGFFQQYESCHLV